MSATTSKCFEGNGHVDHTMSSPRDSRPLPPARSPYFAWKGLLDRLAVGLLLIPGVPMIGILVMLVRLTSRGAGIYRQARVGRNGRVFTMYKLRSMRVDAEARSGPTWAAPGKDPRVTPLGYWLRRLHLDELPQLFNVLKGDMSLIGPRPERPEFVEVLGRYIPEYHHRHLVAPGITGLAQINLPPDSDLESVRRKVALDLEYIRTASLTLDCRMFVCTLLRMLGLRGDRAMRLMAVDRPIPVVKPAAGVQHVNGHESGNVRLADLMQSLGLGAEANTLLAQVRRETAVGEPRDSAVAACSTLTAKAVAAESAP